jgi:xylan 1,4-beta-xylosidase
MTVCTAALAGCAGGGAKQEIEYIPPAVERYENHIEIEGQWGESNATGQGGQYGIGDPFVMKFNGKYYLYPSTSDPCDGIKVFESDDLIHWKDKGLAVAESEKTAHGAYAPEVVYYNGYFYLCQSRGGNGHYIYRSQSPTEGFTLFSKTADMDEGNLNYGNLGMGIDGAFYVSDDGKLYLLHTSTPAGLKYNEITDPEDIRAETLGATGSLGVSNLRHWIEGPGIFRRGAFSYLTYTGNHVISKGYRVGYSYAENLSGLSSFVQPTDNVTILDTADEHYGLGHSSNVNGPDLDSVYTAYHSLVGRGPARRYNLDRYFASGSYLTANGVTHRPVAVPQKPQAEGYAAALTERGGMYVLGETDEYFTAECNFVPAEEQELVFGKDYAVKTAGGKLVLTKDGKTVAEKAVPVPEGALACVRVEHGDGVGYVYYNGMRVLSYAAQDGKGALGYKTKDGVGYTAFTNDVFGTSDFEAFKNFPTKFPAVSYLKGEMRGFSIAKARRTQGGVRVGEKENTVRIGDAYAVSLGKNDWVKYAVDVKEGGGMYSINAEVSKASAGAKLKITIGERELIATVPALQSDGQTARVRLGDLAAEGGVQTMKVEVLSGKAEITLFEAHEREEGAVNLAEYNAMHGSVRTEQGIVLDGTQDDAVLLWKNTRATDFEAKIEFSSRAQIGADIGVMLRASHYSYYSAQPKQSWRGYYLQLGSSLLSFKRYDYGDLGMLEAARTPGSLFDGARHTLTICAKGHTFSVMLDTVKLNVSDGCAFFDGYLGIYASKGSVTIHSLDYKTI